MVVVVVGKLTPREVRALAQPRPAPLNLSAAEKAKRNQESRCRRDQERRQKTNGGRAVQIERLRQRVLELGVPIVTADSRHMHA